MSTTQIFVVAIAAVSVVAAIAVFAVAFRRAPEDGPVGASLDARALKRDRARVKAASVVGAEPAAVAVLTEEEEPPEPVPDPLQERPAVSKADYGATRRQFFNRALLGVFGVFLLQYAIGFLAFFWPKLRSGGFGSEIDAGDLTDIIEAINQPDGTISPLFVPQAQAYIVPFPDDPEGSSFDSTPAPVIAGGVMALWQRCVHLGCRVPTCLPSQGFECPCHGSRYNFHGEYEAGPAPRNLDRFAIVVDDDNHLIVDTGTIIQTARAKNKTISYPQGPSCLSG